MPYDFPVAIRSAPEFGKRLSFPPVFQLIVVISMLLKITRMAITSLYLWISKLWQFICYVLRKQVRMVSISPSESESATDELIIFCFKAIQHQTIKYEMVPLSPLTRTKLSQFDFGRNPVKSCLIRDRHR